MRPLLALLVVMLALPTAAAYPDPAKAPMYFESECFEAYDRRFVHDYVGMFTAWASDFEGAACEVYATTSAHVVFVSVPDTEGEPLESYALHLFEEWGIGDAERLDGLLILYVADYLGTGDAALRIEVGYGLEGVLGTPATRDAWAIMEDARDNALAAGEPERDAHAYAIAAGSVYMMGTLRDGYTDAGFPEPTPHSDAAPLFFWIVVIILVILLIALLSRSSRGRRGWGYYPGTNAWSGRGAGMWLPSGGGFGGGGSFGGGRSGGGGRGGKF